MLFILICETIQKRWTPLHFAASSGMVEVIRVLRQYGAECNAEDSVCIIYVYICMPACVSVRVRVYI